MHDRNTTHVAPCVRVSATRRISRRPRGRRVRRSDNNFVGVPVPTGTVVTFRDTKFDFTHLQTFAMPDTVVHFAPVDRHGVESAAPTIRRFSSRVRADFLARGYTETRIPHDDPDFVVLVGATATQNYNAYVGYSWYGDWGFYPGWGWYAPGLRHQLGHRVSVVSIRRRDRIRPRHGVVTLIPTLTVNPLDHRCRAAWAGAATGC